MYAKIAKLIEEHETTAYRVAHDIGLTPTAFTDWKNGKAKPSLDSLQKMAAYFGVPITYFLEESGKDGERAE